jgi:hypothetical protein
MELSPGVFESNVATESREPDPDAGGEMHVLCSVSGVEADLVAFHRFLRAGHMAPLPAGAATKWHLTVPFKEFWVIA